MGTVAQISEKEFAAEVLEQSVPVLVDFWAPWCYPCQMMAPVLEEISGKFEGKLKVAKINTDENPKVSSEYSISAIPTLILFKEGKAVQRFTGYSPADALSENLTPHI